MTDDNDQAGAFSGASGDEGVLAHLIDRHNDLVQAWEDNEDPEVRAQISFEIRQLDAQINQLTDPQPPAVVVEPEQPLYVTPDQNGSPSTNGAFSSDDTKTTSYLAPEDWAAPEEGLLHDAGAANDGEIGIGHDTSQDLDFNRSSDDFDRATDNFDRATGDLDLGRDLDFDRAADDGPAIGKEGPPIGGLIGGSGGQLAAEMRGGESEFLGGQPTDLPLPDRADLQPQAGRYEFKPGAVFGTESDGPGVDNTGRPAPANPDEGSEVGGLTRSGGQFVKPSGPVLAVVGVCLALLAGVLWFGNNDQPNETQADAVTTALTDPASPDAGGDTAAVLSNVRVVLDGLGLTSVVVDERDGVIHIGGPVPNQADYDAAATAARAVAGAVPIDTAALVVMGDQGTAAPAPPPGTDRGEALQMELDRLLAANPLIFASGQSALTELHQRILNNAVLVLTGYPPMEVTIAGFTDQQGDEASNQGLSLSRAENVKAYLVGQGIASENLQVRADGEQGTSGSEELARLERRVEFEVTGAGVALTPEGDFRVAIVAPSASNDLAFTQSMVDAVNLLATEVSIELAVTDNTFVPDEAAAAVQSYAEQGFDLVIAHGSQFGAALIDIAPQFPETAFAWGTASDTFGLPNVYAYDAAAQEGGYVLGALASSLSSNKVAGVVGPIEVGDAQQYINGFDAGAKAENPGTNVLVSYTGSFSDIALATETAQSHIANGADVLTGSAQMVVGAISATDQQGGLWFGTQANQTSLAPGSVVASQVYHWEVAIRPILNDISAGTLAGTTYTANLANGGLVIEYNPDFALSPEARQRADELTAAIASGSITPPE